MTLGVPNLDLKPNPGGYEFVQVAGRDNRVLFVPVISRVFPCFCGDLNRGQTLSLEDVARDREALAQPLALPLDSSELGRCLVFDPLAAAKCRVSQVAVMLHALQSGPLLPAIQDVCGGAPPDALENYSGTEGVKVFGCSDPADNCSFNVVWNLNVFEQRADGRFLGVGAATFRGTLRTIQFEFDLDPNGILSSGSYRFDDMLGASFEAHGDGTLSGSLVGDTLNLTASGRDQIGSSCVYNGGGSFTR